MPESRKSRIRASAAAESLELVPLAYDGVRAALASGDLKSADAGSRVIVNLTRGFLSERIELAPPKTVETADELAAILARNGVLLTSEHKASLSDASAKTPSNPPTSETTQRSEDAS